MVAQDSFVLEGSVRENLDIADKKSDAEIWAACEAVQLKSAIIAFEGKLDHPLTARGRELLQGQMQLLAMARATLRGNKIVILDEATGNLDTETDTAVQEVIRTAFTDKTVITVAHRTATIVDYSQVVVLDQGRISEIGDPTNLISIRGGAFAQLLHAGSDH